MSIKRDMSKRTVRVAGALALAALVGVVAISLLMAGAGGARAFEAGASDGAARDMPIPAQYTEQCSNGVAVPNPGDNAGLVADCAVLLAAKDALVGTTGSLSWSADRNIAYWRDGVRIADGRVTGLTPSNKSLNGVIPAELGNLDKLEMLYLYQNDLTGAIPAELGNLANLKWMRLWANELTGEIPGELGNLDKLRLLELYENELTGAIPAELGDLSNLMRLDLHDNRLTGDIPAELGNLDSLLKLILSENQLTGDIPSELGSLANLEELWLSYNQLTGEIPAELGKLANLRKLILSVNRLTGDIPSELSRLSNLEWLYLSANQLTGEIPAWLGSLTRLDLLSLSDNQLTGEIPPELGNLANLTYVFLHGNQLTGCVPASLRAHMTPWERQRIELPFCDDISAATPTPTATSAPGATATATSTPSATSVATLTPTATSVPGETPVATPTPTATSVPGATATATATTTPAAGGEVLGKLDELERRVGEDAELSGLVAEIVRLVAALVARVAEIEGGDTGAATATPTHTPTATPVVAIEPTATLSPTPTSVAGAGGEDACVTALVGSGSVRGSWSGACLSANSPHTQTYYARFYTFTLDASSEVTTTLSSDDVAPYLYLLDGAGTGGAVKLHKGVAGASSVTITASLGAGAYTIEATTWGYETVGDFTLELEIAQP